MSGFRGFDGPNYTQTPNQLFDELMADLPESELKVLLYIIRRTFGFGKGSDDISINQMAAGLTAENGRALDRGTGLSRRAVINGVNGLVEKGVIIATRNVTAKHGHEASTYRLRLMHDPSAPDALASASNDPSLVHKMHPQKKDEK